MQTIEANPAGTPVLWVFMQANKRNPSGLPRRQHMSGHDAYRSLPYVAVRRWLRTRPISCHVLRTTAHMGHG